MAGAGVDGVHVSAMCRASGPCGGAVHASREHALLSTCESCIVDNAKSHGRLVLCVPPWRPCTWLFRSLRSEPCRLMSEQCHPLCEPQPLYKLYHPLFKPFHLMSKLYHPLFKLFHPMSKLYHTFFKPFHLMSKLNHTLFKSFHLISKLYHTLFKPFHLMSKLYHPLFKPFHLMSKLCCPLHKARLNLSAYVCSPCSTFRLLHVNLPDYHGCSPLQGLPSAARMRAHTHTYTHTHTLSRARSSRAF